MALDVGIIGVGSMGTNHARVYSELPNVNLVGVCDANPEQAAAVAEEYETTAMTQTELIDCVDAASVVVPTTYHAGVASQLIDAGVDTLVEKPFVDDLDVGRRLAQRAADEGVILQVGHIEQFNPAVQALSDIISDVEPIAFEAKRLGPPVDRQMTDSVMRDLMIHDVDIIASLVQGSVETIDAVQAAEGQYANAQLTFTHGEVGTLTASRVTQRKVRTLTITAAECLIEVDYIDQSIEIHRHSVPEYAENDGDLLYRHQSVIEQPLIQTAEPLREELSSFVETVRTRGSPVISAEKALHALKLTQIIEQCSERPAVPTSEVIEGSSI
jgi:predicted dehydrogenase